MRESNYRGDPKPARGTIKTSVHLRAGLRISRRELCFGGYGGNESLILRWARDHHIFRPNELIASLPEPVQVNESNNKRLKKTAHRCSSRFFHGMIHHQLITSISEAAHELSKSPSHAKLGLKLVQQCSIPCSIPMETIFSHVFEVTLHRGSVISRRGLCFSSDRGKARFL